MKFSLDYNDYWCRRGIEIRKKLIDREKIFLKWIKRVFCFGYRLRKFRIAS